MHTIGTTMLHTEKMWDITCKTLVSELCHSSKISFKLVIMSANGILQKQQYINGLKHDITKTLFSVEPTILHVFHDSKGH